MPAFALRATARQALGGQPPRVNRHPHHGVHAKGVQLVDFLLGGDSAGGDDPPGGRIPNGLDGPHVGALHQALLVHVRVEELGAIRFQGLHGFDSRKRHGFAPALHGDAPALGVDGGYHPVSAYGVGELGGKVQRRTAVPEQRRPDDHVGGSLGEHVPRALDRPDAPADTAHPLTTDVLHQRVVVPGPDGGVQIDQLQLGKRGKAPDPPVEIGILQGEALTLDELDDFAVAEVDGGNQHSLSSQSRWREGATARRSVGKRLHTEWTNLKPSWPSRLRDLRGCRDVKAARESHAPEGTSSGLRRCAPRSGRSMPPARRRRGPR